MTRGKGEESPPKTPKKARAERLAAALRVNLKRRKAQARGRASTEPAAGEPENSPHKTGR
jgi:hypothetical protein